MEEIKGNNRTNIHPADLLKPREIKNLKEAIKQYKFCLHCKAGSSPATVFCGNCGTANIGFDEEVFEQQFGKALEQVQIEQGCQSGKHPYANDSARTALYCIFCGTKY
jgi:ribosomal protein L40E